MAKLIASYNLPVNPAAVDDYYFNKHLPLAKTIPGLPSDEVSKGDVMAMAGRQARHVPLCDSRIRFDGGDPGCVRVTAGTGNGR